MPNSQVKIEVQADPKSKDTFLVSSEALYPADAPHGVTRTIARRLHRDDRRGSPAPRSSSARTVVLRPGLRLNPSGRPCSPLGDLYCPRFVAGIDLPVLIFVSYLVDPVAPRRRPDTWRCPPPLGLPQRSDDWPARIGALLGRSRLRWARPSGATTGGLDCQRASFADATVYLGKGNYSKCDLRGICVLNGQKVLDLRDWKSAALSLIVIAGLPGVGRAVWFGLRNDVGVPVVVYSCSDPLKPGKSFVLNPGEMSMDGLVRPGTRFITIRDRKNPKRIYFQSSVPCVRRLLLLPATRRTWTHQARPHESSSASALKPLA